MFGVRLQRYNIFLLPAQQARGKLSCGTMAMVSRALDFLRIRVGSVTWGPLLGFSRSTVLGLLTRVEIGRITVTDYDGTTIVCGEGGTKNGRPTTELKVLKEAFWVRVMLFADMVSDNRLQAERIQRLAVKIEARC